MLFLGCQDPNKAMKSFILYPLASFDSALAPMPRAYSLQAVNGAISSLSISLAFVADLLAPQHRAACFGLIMASFSVGESCSQPAQPFHDLASAARLWLQHKQCKSCGCVMDRPLSNILHQTSLAAIVCAIHAGISTSCIKTGCMIMLWVWHPTKADKTFSSLTAVQASWSAL